MMECTPKSDHCHSVCSPQLLSFPSLPPPPLMNHNNAWSVVVGHDASCLVHVMSPLYCTQHARRLLCVHFLFWHPCNWGGGEGGGLGVGVHIVDGANKTVRGPCFFVVVFFSTPSVQSTCFLRPNHRVWGPITESIITSPYVDSRADSNTSTMGNPMPESTLTLGPSRPGI
jgi:hypothetical protein